MRADEGHERQHLSHGAGQMRMIVSDQDMLICPAQLMCHSLAQKEGLKHLFASLKFIGQYGDIKFTIFCRICFFSWQLLRANNASIMSSDYQSKLHMCESKGYIVKFSNAQL